MGIKVRLNRVFITGGAGFIGTELCEQLISVNSNIAILIYDNLYPPVHGLNAHANTQKAGLLLNWKPTINIKEGLQRLVGWVKLQD